MVTKLIDIEEKNQCPIAYLQSIIELDEKGFTCLPYQKPSTKFCQNLASDLVETKEEKLSDYAYKS